MDTVRQGWLRFTLIQFSRLKINCLFKFFFILLLHPFALQAQQPESSSSDVEQQLEAITENSEDNETEDDSFIQSMRQYLIHPLNLSTANLATLQELSIFSAIQIQQLISYRNRLGNFISIYELQAIPSFDLRLIEKIRPFVTVNVLEYRREQVGKRMSAGKHSLLTRVTQVIEKSKGYLIDPRSGRSFYPGANQKYLFRYQYQFKNLLQYGVVGEKDAGEKLFKGVQKSGFDFYSAHFFVRNIGLIRSLAIGDFTVNLGQGLIQWQSLAFKKSSEVINTKRQLAVLRPYHSSGEIIFHRGVGITVAKNKMQATAFLSYKKIDANIIFDSLGKEDFISSFQYSGLHRTSSELIDKGGQRQFIVGGNLAYTTNRLHVGFNAVQYQFSLPIKKTSDPYNFYSLSGNELGNYSMDYSYGYRNTHFYGEVAFSNAFEKAMINGLIVSADPKVDVNILYRNISKGYQSLYTNVFTESNLPNNEKGFYTGISIRPWVAWRVDAYIDFYQFPWLKYQVDAPSFGKDYLFKMVYKPNKQLEIYIRYRTESKFKNFNPDNFNLSPVLSTLRQNIRTQINFKVNSTLTYRNRVEMVWFSNRPSDSQTGFLIFSDCIFKPMMKRYSGGIRLQYFETDDYNSRIYVYENDLLYSFSIPVFYDKGFRYYLNFNYGLSKNSTVWLRWSQTIYKDKFSIGSGLDEIAGNKKSEIKLQWQFQF
jgi:hypothetical protein